MPDDFETTHASQNDIRDLIRWYMVGHAVGACILFLVVIIYFPSMPDSPPTASAMAKVERTPQKFTDSVKALLLDKNVMMCTIAFAMSTGIQVNWQCVMPMNFEPLGVDQRQSGCKLMLAR